MPEGSPARDAAIWALGRWRKDGGRAEALIAEAFVKYALDARDRALTMELVYGVIRNLSSLDFTLSKFIKQTSKGVQDEIRDILRLAAYQVMRLDRVPERAAVYEAVEQAKIIGGKGAGSFVNGVLRSLIRGRDAVVYPDLPIRYSYPGWLAKRWLGRFGPDEAEALMAAGNSVPPLTLRANTLVTDREKLAALLNEAGIDATPTKYAPDGLVIKGYPQVRELPGYAVGLFAVQDEAAQLVSLLVSPKSGDTVLDACAAPGGKSTHMAALSDGKARITAADIGLDKIRVLKENITRLKANGVDTLLADATAPIPVEGLFDKVLLDAPCSALGVIRRRPEIKYARREEDIARLAELQGRMLENLASLVKPGGVLVYSVCSTEPEEGELLIEKFLKANPAFILDDPAQFLPVAARELVIAPGYVRTYPHRHGTDGFFMARLCRK